MTGVAVSADDTVLVPVAPLLTNYDCNGFLAIHILDTTSYISAPTSRDAHPAPGHARVPCSPLQVTVNNAYALHAALAAEGLSDHAASLRSRALHATALAELRRARRAEGAADHSSRAAYGDGVGAVMCAWWWELRVVPLRDTIHKLVSGLQGQISEKLQIRRGDQTPFARNTGMVTS